MVGGHGSAEDPSTLFTDDEGLKAASPIFSTAVVLPEALTSVPSHRQAPLSAPSLSAPTIRTVAFSPYSEPYISGRFSRPSSKTNRAVGLSLSGHFPASRFLEASSRKTPTRGAAFGVGFGFSAGGVAVVVWRRCSGVVLVLRRWSCAAGAEELRRWSDDAVVLRRCSGGGVVLRGGSVLCSAAATGKVAARAAAPRAARVRSMMLVLTRCAARWCNAAVALRCAAQRSLLSITALRVPERNLAPPR